MSELAVRAMSLADSGVTLALYKTVAAVPDSGLARLHEEISGEYVDGFLSRAAGGDVSLGAFVGSTLAGEMHATRLTPRQFSHVLTDLTVAVHPEMQGRGIATRLFAALFETVAKFDPPITRIELVARTGNVAARRLYERLGFRPEGCFRNRVRLPDGHVEDDIPMARLL